MALPIRSLAKTTEISGLKNIFANPIKEALTGLRPFLREWGNEWRGGEDESKAQDRSSFDVLYNDLGGSRSKLVLSVWATAVPVTEESHTRTTA